MTKAGVIIILLALVIGLVPAGPALSAQPILTPASLPRGGTAALIITDPPPDTEYRALFLGRPVPFFRSGDRVIGLVGVDVTTQPGRYRLKLTAQAPAAEPAAETLALAVTDKDYGARRLQVTKSKVDISAADLARHKREKKLVQAALATVSPVRLWQGPFLRPVDGKVVSNFGRKTFINGQPRKKPHTGVDLRGKTGTPVKAPARGRVLLAGFHFFAGGSIYLDHGQGLISMYFHLSAIDVKAGQMLERGQIIGRVGATGRVTGPHLHYGIYLAGARIDPLAFQNLTARLGIEDKPWPRPSRKTKPSSKR